MRLLAIALTIVSTPAVAHADAAQQLAQSHVALAGGHTEEATIRSAPGVTLAATLRLPATPGPHPVVLLQSGSGANRRGGFDALQRRLADAGIASLEFDKRGVGRSTGTFTDTMDDMEADLAAAIGWLRARPDVDGTRIALLGHSQGAAAAPVVAARDGRLAAIVTLAGPVGARGTMFLDAMRAQFLAAGRPAAATERAVAATGAWMEARGATAAAPEVARHRADLVTALVAAGFGTADAEAAVRGLDTPQLLSFYRAAPGTALAQLHIPVLALLAARDEIVEQTAAAATAALADNPRALVIEVPGAGHNFGYRPVGAPARTSAPGGAWLSLLPADLVVDWLAGALGVGGASEVAR